MECGSEFQELASRNPFVRDLEEQGFLLDFVNGYFIVYGIPYLDANGALQHGDWASPINRDAEGVIGAPGEGEHQAWFRGSRPHDGRGHPLKLGGGEAKVTISDDFVTDYSFSLKLQDAGQNRLYSSFEEKLHTYIDMITGPAMAAFEDATPLRAIEKRASAHDSPLRIPDDLSARYNINDVSFLLRGKKVGIIGLGGTGAYILDFVARTHLAEIRLYDDDKVHLHTIFRQPGFIRRAIGKPKVEALAGQYGNWHGRIVAVPERIIGDNIESLRDLDFVFIAVDDGPARFLIADWLSRSGIPFVDTGMGLARSKEGLNGVVRITGVDREAYERTAGTVYLPRKTVEGGEYRKQAQIAELNALNAAWAVIRFKQHFGLLERQDDSIAYLFETASFDLDKRGTTNAV
jgi:hypothetical protein